MKKFREKWKQVVAAFLVVTMFSTSVSLEAFATEKINVTETQAQEEDIQKEDLTSIGGYEISKEEIVLSEKTENTTTYDIGNGQKLMEIYSQDVRFRDDAGSLKEYDPTLIQIQKEETENGHSLEGYAYENMTGDRKQYFPEQLTEETPILLEHKDYEIRLFPVMPVKRTPVDTGEELTQKIRGISELSETILETKEAELTKVELTEEKVTDIYEEEKELPVKAVYPSVDETMSFEYTSTDNGVKEEIVLAEVPETNVFTCTIEIPGLAIRKNVTNEGLTIYDEDEIVAGIMAPNMNDATGNAYSEALTYELETIDEEAGKYRLILRADETYLYAQERKYPVVIDPTLTWYGDALISDVYVLNSSTYKNTNFYESGTSVFYVGETANGLAPDLLCI